MEKCSMCEEREVELSLNAELSILKTHKLYKKIPNIKLCRNCADIIIGNICFTTDQPKNNIINAIP